MANFNGQTAVITGGAQGIGLATAKSFINDGCEVMIWDIDEKMGVEAAKELNCHFLKVDQTNNNLVEEVTEKTLKQINKIDILVCSAGIAGPTCSTWDYPVEEVASLITFLASKENSFTTAGVFDISGGRATY